MMTGGVTAICMLFSASGKKDENEKQQYNFLHASLPWLLFFPPLGSFSYPSSFSFFLDNMFFKTWMTKGRNREKLRELELTHVFRYICRRIRITAC
jgi:hypothetical protein